MAIPKIIHYCWFGGSNMPKDFQICLDSWKKYCPDYQIIRWDESNYDYNQFRFTKEAYEHKKWAFVSDVARLDVVYRYGGIYLDVDVELIRPLDFLLEESAFMGFEQGRMVATGLGFGAEAGNEIIGRNLEAYNGLLFVNQDGSLNMQACPLVTTQVLERYGLIRKDEMQELDGIKVFPTSYFCPMLFADGRAEIKPETVSIHHYAASWTTDEERKLAMKRREVYTTYGRLGLRVYDGAILLQQQGWKTFVRRCAEIIVGR